MMWGTGWGGGFAGILMMILFWAVPVALIYLLVTGRRPSSRGDDAGPGHASEPADARTILAERFARGEIDAQEFEERRRVLEGGR